MITSVLEGGQRLHRKLGVLPKKVAKKIVRTSMRKAFKPMLAAAKTNAKSNVGGKMGSLLAKNLTLRAFKKQKKGSYGLAVQLRPNPELIHLALNSKYFRGRSYIPAAIEYGHGANKDQAARPFMRPAFDSNKGKTGRMLRSELGKQITKAARTG